MPTDTKTLYDSLVEAAKTVDAKFKPRGKKESDRDYLHRLVGRVSEAEQPAFDAMPEEAKAWFNGAVDALNDETGQTELAMPDGYQPTAEAVAPATPAARAPRKRAENTAGKVIRTALIEDQSISSKEILERLAAAGFKDVKEATVSSYRTDTLATLAVAAEMGRFTPSTSNAGA